MTSVHRPTNVQSWRSDLRGASLEKGWPAALAHLRVRRGMDQLFWRQQNRGISARVSRTEGLHTRHGGPGLWQHNLRGVGLSPGAGEWKC
jgi:hypothetical protein